MFPQDTAAAVTMGRPPLRQAAPVHTVGMHTCLTQWLSTTGDVVRHLATFGDVFDYHDPVWGAAIDI